MHSTNTKKGMMKLVHCPVRFMSDKLGVECIGNISNETHSLYAVDIKKINIDNTWISFSEFEAIVKKISPLNTLENYEVVEKYRAIFVAKV